MSDVNVKVIDINVTKIASALALQIQRIVYISIGLSRVFPNQDLTYIDFTRLAEPDEAKLSRRKILALAIVVCIASFAGADPRDLEIFGVKPSSDWGVLVLGIAVILGQLYWYMLRYYIIKDAGEFELNPLFRGKLQHPVRTYPRGYLNGRINADLISNWAAFVFTAISWIAIGVWIFRWSSQFVLS